MKLDSYRWKLRKPKERSGYNGLSPHVSPSYGRSGSETVIRLLADVNIEGHVARPTTLMQSNYWRDYWEHLDLHYLRFQDVGLSPDDADAHVWQVCQQQGLYLLTNNRNDDGPDSLEATIRQQTTEISLPVFTLSDADQVFLRKDYAERVIETLFDYLLRIDSLRGTGRLFLP
jgi:hypothetical protein